MVCKMCDVDGEDCDLQEVTYVKSSLDEQECRLESLEREKNETVFLRFIIYTGFLPLIVGGSNLVWLSSTYPLLISNNSDINPLKTPATTGDISMIGGLPSLVGLIGPLLMIKVSDLTGRKLFLHTTGLIFFISIVLLIFANSALLIVVMRSSIILMFNTYGVVFLVYINEICEYSKKSKYMVVIGTCVPVGYIYGYYFGPLCSYKLFTTIIGIPMLPFLIGYIFAPESPVYLLSKGRKKECFSSLKKLRGNKTDAELQTDLLKMQSTLESTNSTEDKNILNLFINIKSGVKYATLLTVIVGVAPHASGMTTLITFLGPLLKESDVNLSENTMTVTVALVQMICILATSFIVEKVNRRTLLLASCFTSVVPTLFLGLFYYFKFVGFSWLPLCLIALFNVTFSVGLGSLPAVLVSEIFPSDYVAAAITFFICIQGVAAFAIVSLYPFIVEYFGVYVTMWVFSAGSLASGVLIYFLVPETRGKTVVEVQNMLIK